MSLACGALFNPIKMPHITQVKYHHTSVSTLICGIRPVRNNIVCGTMDEEHPLLVTDEPDEVEK